MEGNTILLTTHSLEEADQLCKKVAFIIKGRIVANDTPENLKLTYGKRSKDITLQNRKTRAILVMCS